MLKRIIPETTDRPMRVTTTERHPIATKFTLRPRHSEERKNAPPPYNGSHQLYRLSQVRDAPCLLNKVKSRHKKKKKKLNG